MEDDIVDLSEGCRHDKVFRQKSRSHSVKVIKAIEGQLRDVAFEIGHPRDHAITWEYGSYMKTGVV